MTNESSTSGNPSDASKTTFTAQTVAEIAPAPAPSDSGKIKSAVRKIKESFRRGAPCRSGNCGKCKNCKSNSEFQKPNLQPEPESAPENSPLAVGEVDSLADFAWAGETWKAIMRGLIGYFKKPLKKEASDSDLPSELAKGVNSQISTIRLTDDDLQPTADDAVLLAQKYQIRNQYALEIKFGLGVVNLIGSVRAQCADVLIAIRDLKTTVQAKA